MAYQTRPAGGSDHSGPAKGAGKHTGVYGKIHKQSSDCARWSGYSKPELHRGHNIAVARAGGPATQGCLSTLARCVQDMDIGNLTGGMHKAGARTWLPGSE